MLRYLALVYDFSDLLIACAVACICRLHDFVYFDVCSVFVVVECSLSILYGWFMLCKRVGETSNQFILFPLSMIFHVLD